MQEQVWKTGLYHYPAPTHKGSRQFYAFRPFLNVEIMDSLYRRAEGVGGERLG